MSSSELQGSTRRRLQGSPKTPARDMAAHSDSPHTRSSSLQRNQASIRPLHSANGHNYGREEEDDVELSLLGDQERRQAALGVDNADVEEVREKPKVPLSTKDKKAVALLIILYLIQGVPLGLALGSVPFLLREHLSYAQLGFFSLASYPYSLKLFWSPIVDSIFHPSIGRRKSWICPMQLVIGTTMLWISTAAIERMNSPDGHEIELTVIWTLLVFFAATQDIAVDGWALTLLSEDAKSYASTAQTVGLNTGYFASYTVFLALNSTEFANKWGFPPLSLERYLQFWAMVCYSVTVWLLLFKREDPVASDDPDLKLVNVYQSMWKMCKLRHIQKLFALHFVAKIAWQAHDAATSLKLVEKGLPKEDFAIAALIDFPIQIAAGWLAGRWSVGNQPLRPWLYAWRFRAAFAVVGMFLVYTFRPPVTWSWMAFVIIFVVLAGFSSTIQFVGISAFHTRISDPTIGGTYMTMLNTAANLGGTWPGFFVLRGIDYFTIATCKVKEQGSEILIKASECVSDHGKGECKAVGGECVTERDGYYIVSTFCVITGIIIFITFIRPTALALQAVPISKWRIHQQNR